MRKRIFQVLGIFIVGCGLYLSLSTYSTHQKYDSDMHSLLDNSVIYDAKTKQVVKNKATHNPKKTSIEALTSDQKIGEIAKGTPTLEIPSLKIKVPVVRGTDSTSLRYGAGMFDGSANMGARGNFCVAGHSSTIYNCIFNDLENIHTLARINCYNGKGKCFKYYVTATFKAEPTDMSVLTQTNDKTMTIVTCTDGGTRRFIVVAKLMSDKEYKTYKQNSKDYKVSHARSIVDSYLGSDISSYFNKNVSYVTLPYDIKFNAVTMYSSIFRSYGIPADKLIKNKHILCKSFNQDIGFDISSVLEGGEMR